MVLTTNLAFENWVSVSAAKSKSCLTSQSWQGRAIGEAVAWLLWWVYMLLISLEMIVISKIVTYSSPGGQWLPLRGHDAVPSLSHPFCTPSILLIKRLWIQIPRHLKKISHQNNYKKMIPNKLCLFKLTSFLQFKSSSSLHSLRIHLSLESCSTSLPFSPALDDVPNFFTFISFHYPFMNPILSSILYDLWKTI